MYKTFSVIWSLVFVAYLLFPEQVIEFTGVNLDGTLGYVLAFATMSALMGKLEDIEDAIKGG